MLAARMYNKKDIRVEEAPIPAIEEDGILLKVKAAAICGTAVYNVAGTRAAAVADAPASFKVAFIDELYRATAQDIADNQLELEEA